MKTELDLFSVSPTQVSLEKGLRVDHQPVSSVSDAGPITFVCSGTENYMDLSKTILVVCAKVTKADRKQVTQATGMCVYHTYLEMLLSYNPAAKQCQLTAAMFYKDTAGKMDAADPTAANAYLGLKERYVFSHESRILKMAGPLF